MTDEIVKIENCRVAMKAALEAIQDYCGMAPKIVRIGGVEFQLPEEVHEVLENSHSSEDAIKRIEQLNWTQDEAEKMCHELIRAKDPAKCRHHMAQSIAHAIVKGEELSEV